MSRRAKATLISTVLGYAVLMYSVFAGPDFRVCAFGPTAFGLATPVTVAIIVTLLYLPAPRIVWHRAEIYLRALDLGMPLDELGFFYTLFTIGRRLPELRHSQVIVIFGFFYFLVVVAAWIYYAGSHGI